MSESVNHPYPTYIVYLNGDFVEEKSAQIPIGDRGFLFGDGIFTTVRVEQGIAIHLMDHLERIKQQCDELRIDFSGLDQGVIQELIVKNQATNGVWRMKIVITGGDSPNLALPLREYGTLLVTLKPYTELQKPTKLCIYPYASLTKIAHLKTLSYLERLCIKQYALDCGCDDALVLTPDKFILETAFSNIFWVHDDLLYTPQENNFFLKGIAIKNFLRSNPLRVVEGNFKIDNIPESAKIFLCNSMTGIKAVGCIVSQRI